MEILAHKIQK